MGHKLSSAAAIERQRRKLRLSTAPKFVMGHVKVVREGVTTEHNFADLDQLDRLVQQLREETAR